MGMRAEEVCLPRNYWQPSLQFTLRRQYKFLIYCKEQSRKRSLSAQLWRVYFHSTKYRFAIGTHYYMATKFAFWKTCNKETKT